jgi:outer membrane immunogenic protein
MKYLFAASAVALACAAPVAAQESPAEAASGLRVEGRVGLDINEVSADYDDGVDTFEGSDSQSDLGYGAEVGFDFPVGESLVVGAYAGLDFSDAEYCSEVFGTDVACIDQGRNITLGVRAGVPLGTNTLIYAKGGYSNGRINVSYDDVEDAIEDFNDGDEVDGFHLGAGVEFGLGRNLYLKGEYVYTNYNGGRYEDTDIEFSTDLTRHQIMAGVGFRF